MVLSTAILRSSAFFFPPPSYGREWRPLTADKTDKQRHLLGNIMLLWKKHGNVIFKVQERFELMKELVHEEANLHTVHCEEKELFRMISRFLARTDGDAGVPPAPSDLQLVRTVKHELEKRVIVLRDANASLKKDIMDLECDQVFQVKASGVMEEEGKRQERRSRSGVWVVDIVYVLRV